MTYVRPQPLSDAYEAEQWYAPMIHFQDVTLGEEGMRAAPPSEAQGRLYHADTLAYLERVGIIERRNGSYSQVTK